MPSMTEASLLVLVPVLLQLVFSNLEYCKRMLYSIWLVCDELMQGDRH